MVYAFIYFLPDIEPLVDKKEQLEKKDDEI